MNSNLIFLILLFYRHHYLITLPPRFPVADVVIVEFRNQALSVYLKQITVSPDPFSKHFTNETCSEKSKLRIQALISEIKALFPATVQCKVYYVMYAPNCTGGKHVPPNHKSSYFFGPAQILSEVQSEHPQRVKRKNGKKGAISSKKSKTVFSSTRFYCHILEPSYSRWSLICQIKFLSIEI